MNPDSPMPVSDNGIPPHAQSPVTDDSFIVAFDLTGAQQIGGKNDAGI